MSAGKIIGLVSLQTIASIFIAGAVLNALHKGALGDAGKNVADYITSGFGAGSLS